LIGVLYLKGTVAPSMTNMQGVLYLKGTVAPSMTNMQSVPITTKVVKSLLTMEIFFLKNTHSLKYLLFKGNVFVKIH
jgi:hypothetical protein